MNDMRLRVQAILAANQKRRTLRIAWLLVNSLGFVLMAWMGCIVAGAVGFYIIEPTASLLDSFYWAVQVATTTGPGDVAPKTEIGKLLFMLYNFVVSVGLLLLLGANIVVRAIKDANVLTHEEQEWNFKVLERIYAMSAQQGEILYALAARANIPLPVPLEGQDAATGAMPLCPPQPSDTGEE